ncbi:MAG TPA: ABC transporter transmembrane domain-containing protein, partial [Chitinophagaceae bacterium]|nr:ABC transporter transmembrane domain-containing protein [Chitinophagaceae bacterium]
MKLSYKNNFWGYFIFYYSIIGNRVILYLALSILISVMDGLGLVMFIPLLEFVGNESKVDGGEQTLGYLHYIIDFIRSLGLKLNVTTILGALTTLFVLKGVLKYIQLTYYANMRALFIKKIRYKLIDNLQGLSYNAFLKLEAGKIQNTFTTEVTRLFLSMTSYFNAAQYFFMLSTYIVLAIMANYQFAILVAMGSGISSLIYRKIYQTTKRSSIELSKKGGDAQGFVVQTIHYFKYLKSTNMFGIYADKLKQTIDKYEQLNKKMGYLKAVTLSIKEPIIIIVVSAVILFQMNWMGTGLNTILLSLLLFYRALSLLVQVQNDWQTFMENIGGIYAVSDSDNEMTLAQEVHGGIIFKGIKQGINLKDIVLHYDSVKAIN